MEGPEDLLEEAHVAELFAEMISPDLLDQSSRTGRPFLEVPGG
jgi:hypothetical protein